MSDAPILSALNAVTDLDSASDFEKKHTPYVTAEWLDGHVMISAEVGHYVAHPNDPDHFIQWMEFRVDGSPVARVDLSPVAARPSASCAFNLDAGTTVQIVAYCNLHGLWSAEVTV